MPYMYVIQAVKGLKQTKLYIKRYFYTFPTAKDHKQAYNDSIYMYMSFQIRSTTETDFWSYL